ncbi:hypothetical protein [Aquiflexum sp.]|uniref:hypothetical protein n=1 Tax=Aquiflexum sp. TaxID=1872584 RepID=UPI003593E72D
MKFNCNCLFIVLLYVSMTFMYNPYPAFAQNPFTDFWAMEGNLVSHHYTDREDPSLGQKILELRGENDLPIWFAKELHKIVCLEGNCRILDLWLFWDGIGDYLGFNLFKDSPLTKTDHVDFDQEDYEKLHRILLDEESILGRMEKENLVYPSVRTDYQVDGYSGATQLSLKEYLVKDAAYTCYTIWHSVYGPVQEEIRRILDRRADNSFLTLLFDQHEPKYKIWAINFIERNPSYYSQFLSQIIDQIKSEDDLLSLKAMKFFLAERLSEPALQIELASRIDEFPDQRRYELLWELAELDLIQDETIIILLDKFGQNKIKPSLIGYIYNLIRPENLKDYNLAVRLRAFLKHENLYVRNLTKKLLMDFNFSVN